MPEPVSAQIRNARLAAGLSQAELDIGETAALLGHRSLEMTRVYSGDGEGEAMIEAYRKMFG